MTKTKDGEQHPDFVNRVLVGLENKLVIPVRNWAMSHYHPKYFWRDDPKAKVEKFESIVKSAKYDFTVVENGWLLMVKDDSDKRVTRVIKHNGFDNNKPTLIWHHGAGNIHYEWQMKLLFNKQVCDKFNVISIKAAHHVNGKDYLRNCMDSFYHWQLTFAGSVLAIEEIIKWLCSNSKEKTVVSGGSMGGIVASWHWQIFDSADHYLPIVAYPNVGEIFTSEAYRTVVDRWSERRHNKTLTDAFAIEVVRKSTNITPVLGQFDQIVRFDKAKEFWRDFNRVVVPTGHMSVVLEREKIRNLLISNI